MPIKLTLAIRTDMACGGELTHLRRDMFVLTCGNGCVITMVTMVDTDWKSTVTSLPKL